MIAQLYPHLPYDDAETADSYIRRLGQFHTGRDGIALLADLTIDPRAFASGTEGAMMQLAEAAGIDLGRLMAGSIQRRTKYWDFRGEGWSRDFLRAEGAAVCPECLREDAVGGQAWQMKGRIAWRLRSIYTCAIHKRRLISPALFGADMGFNEVFRTVSNVGELACEPRDPTALEVSILDRLAGIPSKAGAWLDGQTIEQGAKASEMIGATLTHGLTFGHKALSDEDWRQAGATGFEITSNGADAVTAALSQIAAMSTTTAGQAGPKAIYGRLYEWLAYTSPVLDLGPIRGLLRESILDTIIIEPGESLLGERVVGRRLHSVHSLSIKTGLHRKRLRKILVSAGFVADDSWDVAAHRLVFPMAEAEQLCHDIVDSVSLHLVPEVIGCSRTQAESLYRERTLKPVIDIDATQSIGKLAFARRDLMSLLEEIGLLPVVFHRKSELVDLVSACKRTGRSTGDIMTRVFAGQLAAYREEGVLSFHRVKLLLSDLDPIRTRKPRSVAHLV